MAANTRDDRPDLAAHGRVPAAPSRWGTRGSQRSDPDDIDTLADELQGTIGNRATARLLRQHGVEGVARLLDGGARGQATVSAHVAALAGVGQHHAKGTQERPAHTSPMAGYDGAQSSGQLEADHDRHAHTGADAATSVSKLACVMLGDAPNHDGLTLHPRPDPHALFQPPRHVSDTTKVYIDREWPGDWRHVTLPDGQQGWVAGMFLDTRLPEPGAALYRIKPGDSASRIVAGTYERLVEPGHDDRFYINVLAYVNPQLDMRRLRAGDYLWLPSGPFAQRLKGIVPSGSITGGLWAEAAQAVWTYAEGQVAFDAGLLAGAAASVWDTLTGVVKLVGAAWDLLASLLTGHIVGDAAQLWDTLSHLDVRRLAGAALDQVERDWNDPDIVKRWFFRGKVCGEALAFILLTFFSGGTFAAIKGLSIAGKVADVLDTLPVVSKMMEAARGLKGPEADGLRGALDAGATATGRGGLLTLKDLMGAGKYAECERAIEALKAAHPELRHIPTDNLIAIRGYTTSDYVRLNMALRSQDPVELERLHNYIQSAVAGLEDLPLYRGTVYRGTFLPPEMIVRYTPGAVIKEDAFTSTSLDRGATFGGNVRFEIDSMHGREVSLLSRYPGEKEVLFSPGTTFRVLSVDKSTADTYYIVLREVSSGHV